MESGTFETELRLAQGGDRDVGGRLLVSFQRALVVLAQRLIQAHLRPKADAEDVAQETLLLAWDNLGQFRGSTAEEFAGWLRRILASQLARLFRRYQGTQGRDLRLERPLRITTAHSSWSGAAELAASWTSPSQHAIRAEGTARVEEALAALPRHYRIVLTWHERQGLTFAQIGRVLDRSEQAVRKLWTRGLLALHRAITSTP